MLKEDVQRGKKSQYKHLKLTIFRLLAFENHLLKTQNKKLLNF